MQSLVLKLLLLTIFVAITCAVGYSQPMFYRKPGMRVIDSIEMLMSSPRNNQSPFTNTKPPPALPILPAVAQFRSAATGAMQLPYSPVCSDTSGRYFLEKDSLFFYVMASTRSADGSILAIGQYSNRFDNSITGGFLLKSNERGIAQWTLLYNGSGSIHPLTFCYYYNLLELSDGTLLLAGKILNPANGHYDLLLTHTDKNGAIMWSKTYESKLWIMPGNGSPDYFYIVDMQQDPLSGDIFFTGPHWENGLNVTRMKIADGTILWSKYYGGVSYDFNVPFGMDMSSSELLVFSKFTGGVVNRARIDKITGDTLENRSLILSDVSKPYLDFANADRLVKMDNGHYLLSGKLHRYYISIYDQDQTSPLAHAGVIEVDADFNFVKAWYFSNNMDAGYPTSNTRITLRKDGTGLFSMLNYTSAQVYVQFRDQQILSQRVLYYPQEGIVKENLSVETADGGDLIIKHLRNAVTDKGKIEFLTLHVSDSSSDCLGLKDNSTSIIPYQMQWAYRYMDSVKPNDFKESINRPITVTNIDLAYTAACTQIRHQCDTFSLVKNADTVCMSSPFSFLVRKSPTCNANIFLDYDTTQIQFYTRLNDSLYSFNFKAAGTATIYGSIGGCALLKDSVRVVVMSAPGKIDLGPDTAICPGNTIVLHAKPGFSSYIWQDGSKDSLFAVKQSGLYFVSVVDGCGNVLHDTVSVITRSSVAFDLGPDTSLCAKDSIVLKAPASFTNYRWSPDYYISSLTTPTVFVSPLTDTIYHVRIETTPGCFAEDSLRIHVNHAPSINLGPDKSFCDGDSLVLDAGPGFRSYNWSNGKTDQFIAVYNAGSYVVSAITLGGCKSADTMRVITVFANPKPDLGTDSIICAGTPRLVTTGTYAQYAWNTGSTASTIAVTKTGLYTVMVTDKNSCKGYDSLVITKIVNPPANFLPSDTSICTYGKLDLRASANFDSYAWNTGASSAVITVVSAGIYWLEIKDKNNCIGRDSIVVNSRDCMAGFYVPNAFTPGHDGKNDTFRPLIFGNVLQYEFTVYNRFGQIVFATRQPGQGWDGTATQSANAFVWTCRYQLESEPVRFEKGVVLLLK